MADSLNVTNTADVATDVNVFTAKNIVLDGAVYEAQHTTEGFKVPIVYSQPSTSESGTTYLKQKACYILLPKEEIIKCLREYLQDIIDPSVFKN